MAHYLVIAKPKSERLEELEQQLERRSFETMKPFGRSLTYSLKNARLRVDGIATWEEEDYCSPPSVSLTPRQGFFITNSKNNSSFKVSNEIR